MSMQYKNWIIFQTQQNLTQEERNGLILLQHYKIPKTRYIPLHVISCKIFCEAAFIHVKASWEKQNQLVYAENNFTVARLLLLRTCFFENITRCAPRQNERLYTVWVPKLGFGRKIHNQCFFCYSLSSYKLWSIDL